MTAIEEYLKSNRFQDLVQKLEAGEAVDFDRFAALQSVDLVRIGQHTLAEAMERERLADDEFESAVYAQYN